MLKDSYKLLGVHFWSSDKEIKEAYRNLAMKYHPDKVKGNQKAGENFYEVQKAYEEILADRQRYKNKWSDFVNKIPFRPKKKDDGLSTTRGADIHTYVEITFAESILGCKKTISVNRVEKCNCTKENRATCQYCEGTGFVEHKPIIEFQIPRGVYNMQTLILPHKGNTSLNGGENGDLIINVYVEPSKIYTRSLLDIYVDLHISYPEAVFGTTKHIPTVYGKEKCIIPKGVEDGTKISLVGKGVIDNNTGEVGNEYVIVHVDIPKTITDEQREILKTLYKSFITPKSVQEETNNDTNNVENA